MAGHFCWCPPKKLEGGRNWLWHKSEVSEICQLEKNTEQTYLFLKFKVTADKGIDVSMSHCHSHACLCWLGRCEKTDSMSLQWQKTSFFLLLILLDASAPHGSMRHSHVSGHI